MGQDPSCKGLNMLLHSLDGAMMVIMSYNNTKLYALIHIYDEAIIVFFEHMQNR